MSGFRNTLLPTYRPAPGAYNDAGVWTSTGDYTALIVKCSLQSPTGRDLLSLPEERRTRASFVVFTDTHLRGGSEEYQTNPDICYYAGEFYEVANVQPWQNGVISHYRAIIQKVTGLLDIRVDGQQVPAIDPSTPPPPIVVESPNVVAQPPLVITPTQGQTDFLLPLTPVMFTVLVEVNGQGLAYGTDFTVEGATVRLQPDLGYTLDPTDEVQINYSAVIP